MSAWVNHTNWVEDNREINPPASYLLWTSPEPITDVWTSGLAALTAKGVADTAAARGPVVILAVDRAEMPRYQAMCSELRKAGLRAEVYLGGAGAMAKQLKYADKRKSPAVVIEGENEREEGVVQIKDLALGAMLAETIESNEEWKSQPAQFSAPRADLLSSIQDLLRRAEQREAEKGGAK